jgi:predicted dehydrogenase
MVAYMKRYESSYERMNAELADREIDHVTAYDVDPDHRRIIEEVYDIVTKTVPDSVIEENTRTRHDNALTAIGSDNDALADDYDWHLEHICHDVNVLRRLFGDIAAIDYVDVYAGGRYATAQLRYEGDIRCVLTSGRSERKWFEEFIRVDTPGGMVTLEFDNAFIKNTPAELRLKEGVEELTDTTYSCGVFSEKQRYRRQSLRRATMSTSLPICSASTSLSRHSEVSG